MDYNVRYNIDINGAQASKNISDFQSTIHNLPRNIEKRDWKSQRCFCKSQ